jgi:hypothetical protein
MPSRGERQGDQQVRTPRVSSVTWTRSVLFVLMILAASSAAAQEPQPPSIDALGSEPKPTGPWRIGAFAGAAHNSPINPRLGTTPGRDHLFIGLQAQTTVLKIGGTRLSYGVQFLPAVVIRGRTKPIYYQGPVDDEGLVPGPDKTWAWAFSPFAIDYAVPLGRRLGAYGAAAGGLIFFSRPFPVPEAKASNFTIEYGGGLMWRAGSRTWLQAGYKYHHMSNAYRELVNPGIDAHVVYFGFWRGLGR